MRTYSAFTLVSKRDTKRSHIRQASHSPCTRCRGEPHTEQGRQRAEDRETMIEHRSPSCTRRFGRSALDAIFGLFFGFLWLLQGWLLGYPD